MGTIPRTEPSVKLSMQTQPTMSADALTGPGKALESVGKSLSSLGVALEEPSDAELFPNRAEGDRA